ncbi:hypothetical protein PROFUN_08472 [Planoprotostelium fungivorum]|uniref:Uncharacterized protein n=1 Tax=Planoprotostelium fungivorum TaxID=1890364 RepID=A0A2P6N1U5_9EUKA|nr:hypothetical protein PROFUN_08472 [Planoprotostelium fungivorum]
MVFCYRLPKTLPGDPSEQKAISRLTRAELATLFPGLEAGSITLKNSQGFVVDTEVVVEGEIHFVYGRIVGDCIILAFGVPALFWWCDNYSRTLSTELIIADIKHEIRDLNRQFSDMKDDASVLEDRTLIKRAICAIRSRTPLRTLHYWDKFRPAVYLTLKIILALMFLLSVSSNIYQFATSNRSPSGPPMMPQTTEQIKRTDP